MFNNDKATKSNIFSRLSDRTVEEDNNPDRPFAVRRRMQGYNTAIVVFIAFGLVSWVFTRSVISIGLGLLMAAAIWLLSVMQKKGIKKSGVEIWHLQVLEETYLTRLNRRPTGIYAEALDGPYEGKVCHIALQSQGAIPPVGRIIEIYVLGGVEAAPIRNIYYIPQYLGMELLPEKE